jgi:hypothetical protein
MDTLFQRHVTYFPDLWYNLLVGYCVIQIKQYFRREIILGKKIQHSLPDIIRYQQKWIVNIHDPPYQATPAIFEYEFNLWLHSIYAQLFLGVFSGREDDSENIGLRYGALPQN